MTTLKEVTDKIGSGATPRGGKSVYVSTGTPFIRSQNVLDFRVTEEGMAFLDVPVAEALDYVSVQKGDVLVNITGESVARVAMWNLSSEARVSQHVAIIRCSSEVVLPEYMMSWLLAPRQKNSLLTLASGGGSRRALTKRMLEDFQIRVPKLDEQRAIGDLIGALDGKIVANRKVVETVEDLLSSIWVLACRGGKLVPLSSLADFVNGGAFTKDATGSGRVVVRIAELNSGISASTVCNDLEVPDRQTVRPGDYLMAWSGSLTAARWFRDEAIVNQHIFKVLPCDDAPLWAVACAVQSKLHEFKAIAAGKATTMGHIKRKDLDSPVRWPNLDGATAELGHRLWDRALSAERENLRLAATRDELLPLLMDGKITVKHAEKTVEEVV